MTTRCRWVSPALLTPRSSIPVLLGSGAGWLFKCKYSCFATKWQSDTIHHAIIGSYKVVRNIWIGGAHDDSGRREPMSLDFTNGQRLHARRGPDAWVGTV